MNKINNALEDLIKKQIDPSDTKRFSDALDLFGPVFPSCEVIDGFSSFAPQFLTGEGFEGFSTENCEEMACSQEDSFFWDSRNNFITWLVAEYFGSAKRILDIGCGAGFVTQAMQQTLPSAVFYGTDVYVKGLELTSRKIGNQAFLFHMDARDIPFESKFDLITTFDVLEHIEEDQLVIEQTYEALNPGGGVLHIVPQHPLLWSPVDELAGHRRRYKTGELQSKLRRAGFYISFDSSFAFWLLPLFAVSRWKSRILKEHDLTKEHFVPSWMANIFNRVLAAELTMTKKGARWPVGVSRAVVAVKK